MYDHILVGVDGSDESKRAARYGLELATRVDASVTAVHVVEQGTLELTQGSSEASELREERAAVLAELEAVADEVGQPIETELLEGNPAKRLTAYGNETDADLVVLGRQGISGVKRRLLGGRPNRCCTAASSRCSWSPMRPNRSRPSDCSFPPTAARTPRGRSPTPPNSVGSTAATSIC
ncbi:universal stress protein [Halolamina pelagica]|uniref:universal stress protein n=1 Tax=Halolamina pelagica TaxID=699431 RepID=UPI0019557392|nr:universal stress protein [Halolamina pelagica]